MQNKTRINEWGQIMIGSNSDDFTIDSVREMYRSMYDRQNINLIQKIRLKAWLYHSESRHKNGNPPFYFDNYVRVLGKQGCLDYINLELINCEDIGGKEKAIEAVENWYR